MNGPTGLFLQVLRWRLYRVGRSTFSVVRSSFDSNDKSSVGICSFHSSCKDAIHTNPFVVGVGCFGAGCSSRSLEARANSLSGWRLNHGQSERCHHWCVIPISSSPTPNLTQSRLGRLLPILRLPHRRQQGNRRPQFPLLHARRPL
jgi:hypothetical protein